MVVVKQWKCGRGGGGGEIIIVVVVVNYSCGSNLYKGGSFSYFLSSV